ncbi:MAG: NAD(P)H dehydrogenase assembly family protein [Cyanobacteriota bacterium]|nr:NAD(P)H dehydrogenase assembly family protein [Cyanobacteriota bacterium]
MIPRTGAILLQLASLEKAVIRHPSEAAMTASEGSAVPAAPSSPWQVGERVRLRSGLRYLKTADPMPMLRPPDLVEPGEEGTVSEVRGGDRLAVRFRRGTFLLGAADLSRPVG